MAAQFTLIVLACAVALCSAEAPFRGYSSRQQAAPYPAAGYRPDRAFNLPSDEAIAQQLRLAQVIKLQQQQQQRPSKLYGAPSESEASQPQQPSGLYGTPQEEAQSQQQPQVVRPQRPSQQYGAPQDTAASQQQPKVVRPPSRQYGAPQEAATSQRLVKAQRQQQPSLQYGPPPEATTAAPESNSAESLEESKEVETVAAVSNAIDNKPGRLTQGSDERDTENDEAETTRTVAAAQPSGFVLVPIAAAGYTPQKLAYFQAPAAPTFAKLQLPTLFGVQQPKLLAPQLLAPQGYYQPQQYAFAAPLQQSW